MTPEQLMALASLRHPNILPVHDWGADNGVPYVVTPPPPVDSLSAALVDGRAHRSAATELLAVIAEAVDFAHERGLVHGCLEAAAVLLHRDGSPVVTDFFLASLVASAPPPSGVCYFDAAYVAPERVLGQGVDRATDIYAFAAIVYELLTGEPPFAGAASTADQVYALLDSDPVRPSALHPAIPVNVDEVVMAGLARDPAWRWQTCTDLVRALEWSFRAPPTALAPAAERGPEVAYPRFEVPFTPEPPAEAVPNGSLTGRADVAAPHRDAARGAPRNGLHWFAKTLGVAILCALSAVAGALFIPSGQLSGHDLFGLRQHLPATVAQRLGPTALPGTTTTPAPLSASSPPTQAQAPRPAATPTSAPAASRPPSPAAPSPAAASPGIMVTPTQANRGGVVNVTGTGFSAAQKFVVDVVQAGTDYEIQPATQVPANGIFSVAVIIPGQVTPGAATIKACNVNSSGTAGACGQQQITVA